MQVDGSRDFPYPRATVFRYLLEQDVLSKSLPGVKEMRETAAHTYDLSISLGIAVVRGVYQGSLQVAEIVEPQSCHLIIKGEGGPGFVSADLALVLDETAAGTHLTYSGEAHVGGTIAGVGQRILGGVAKTIIIQFFKSLEQVIQDKEGSGQ